MGSESVRDFNASLASAELAVRKAFAIKKEEDAKPAARNQ
jgi:hypothetical protein